MLETKGLDGKPVKCFAILSIAIQFEPRANAGNAPNHIEEEEEESEGEAEGSPATPPPAIQQMQVGGRGGECGSRAALACSLALTCFVPRFKRSFPLHPQLSQQSQPIKSSRTR